MKSENQFHLLKSPDIPCFGVVLLLLVLDIKFKKKKKKRERRRVANKVSVYFRSYSCHLVSTIALSVNIFGNYIYIFLVESRSFKFIASLSANFHQGQSNLHEHIGISTVYPKSSSSELNIVG